jgi:hypothetical protein
MDLTVLKACAAEHGGEILSITYVRRNNTYTPGDVIKATYSRKTLTI